MNKDLALETLKSFVENTDNVIVKNAILALHPELAESEGERIRKAIIKLLKVPRKEIFEHEGITKEQAIAYLEKQKDLTKEGIIKQLEEEFYACGTTPKWFHDTVQGAINHGRAEALGEIKAHEPVSTIEQKEQKAVINIEHLKSYMLKYLQDASSRKDDSEIEEDTDIYARMIIKIFGNIEQKPAEWGEEDERNFYWISTTIQERHLTPEYTKQVHKILTWLKSLRPQPHWKPSEEQMNTLQTIYERFSTGTLTSVNMSDKLRQLYNDLKKL